MNFHFWRTSSAASQTVDEHERKREKLDPEEERLKKEPKSKLEKTKQELREAKSKLEKAKQDGDARVIERALDPVDGANEEVKSARVWP